MSAMKSIDVDSEAATAWVEAGVAVKDLDDVTCPRGLAAVNGSCTDVGIIGFMLGGGFGFLSRTQGMAVDNCLQMEVVTPAGQRTVASPHEHRELFWALRGAGQIGYGVVTRVQVKLHKLQEEYVGGERVFCSVCLLFSACAKQNRDREGQNKICSKILSPPPPKKV